MLEVTKISSLIYPYLQLLTHWTVVDHPLIDNRYEMGNVVAVTGACSSSFGHDKGPGGGMLTNRCLL